MVRARQFRLLAPSLGFIPANASKVCEDNATVVTSITANKITPRLRHIGLPLAYLSYEHMSGVFQAGQEQSRIKITSTGDKPESVPNSM